MDSPVKPENDVILDPGSDHNSNTDSHADAAANKTKEISRKAGKPAKQTTDGDRDCL